MEPKFQAQPPQYLFQVQPASQQPRWRGSSTGAADRGTAWGAYSACREQGPDHRCYTSIIGGRGRTGGASAASRDPPDTL